MIHSQFLAAHSVRQSAPRLSASLMPGRQSQTTGSIAAVDQIMSSPSKNLSTIECSICCDVFKDPRLLHCGHTFCLSCIQQLARMSDVHDMGRHVVLCPECRMQTPSNEANWIKNYRLSDVVVAVQSLTAQIERTKVESDIRSATPVVAPEEECKLVCGDCNESFTARHTFFCVVCSHGLPFLKLACGTCGITKHPQHQLIAYNELAAREEKEQFIREGVTKLKDVKDLLNRSICTCGRLPSETSAFYKNVVDALGAWEPLLCNLRLNERLTKYDISEYELNLNRFIEFVNQTLTQVKQLEQEVSQKVSEIRQYFQEQMHAAVASIGTSPQERNHPLVSFPSTSGISQSEDLSPIPEPSAIIPGHISSLFVHPSSMSPNRPRLRAGRSLRGGRYRATAGRTTPSSSTASEEL
uniref:RING-type domain-containing protein n=1 Tax=Panagrellus redivivus TaxID=6233 RepID=A0A7E4VXE9_PANRE